MLFYLKSYSSMSSSQFESLALKCFTEKQEKQAQTEVEYECK